MPRAKCGRADGQESCHRHSQNLKSNQPDRSGGYWPRLRLGGSGPWSVRRRALVESGKVWPLRADGDVRLKMGDTMLAAAYCVPVVPATSRRVEIGAHRCEFYQLISLHYSNASSFQSDPPPLHPRAQLFVSAFPRPADDLADLALSDRHFACWF